MLMLLTRLAEQVLEHELNSGADSIAQFVDKSIEALPSGEDLAKVYVSEADSELLTSHSAAHKLLVDKTLNAGECRVESENTLVEYSVSESLQQTIVALANKLLTASDGYPDDSSGETALVDLPDDVPEDLTEDVSHDVEGMNEAGEAEQPSTTLSEQNSDPEPDVEEPPQEPEGLMPEEQEPDRGQSDRVEPETDTGSDQTTEESDDDSEQPLA